jgi:hypothetical protein
MCLNDKSGKISIDKIVTPRSSVIPKYVIIRQDGSVDAVDEVSEDAYDFLTTTMVGNKISFRSYHGHYLSAGGDAVTTTRYCSSNELFEIVMKDHQYAFKARSGKFLSMRESAPFITLQAGSNGTPDETELFQLFSLMIQNINVGKQLEILEKTGSVMIEDLLDGEQVQKVSDALAQFKDQATSTSGHEVTVSELLGKHTAFAELATNPIIMQITKRVISPSAKLSSLESCQTDADFVRKELEETTWNVVHPYKSLEFPGAVDGKMSLTAMWFLDELNTDNCTWSWVPPPKTSVGPGLPALSSPEEIAGTVKSAKPLIARRGSVWLYLGPMWMSNNVGAADFWNEYDAKTRYHDSKKGSFRSLANEVATKTGSKPELCPTVMQATYVREYVVPQDMSKAPTPMSDLSEITQKELLRLLP